MASNVEASVVKKEAAGQWARIYTQLAPSLSEAVKRWGRHVPCPNPGHASKHQGGSKDGFRLMDRKAADGGGVCNSCNQGQVMRDGFAVLQWINGWRFHETLLAVANVLGISDSPSTIPVRRGPTPEEIAEKKRLEEATRLADEQLRQRFNLVYIQEAVRLDDPKAEPARAYLRRRGIFSEQWLKSKELRFHPALNFTDEDGKFQGKWPALLGRFLGPDGKPTTIHRIFIDPEGRKAPFESPKTTMKMPSTWTMRGGAVRLAPVRKVIGVAEGLETSMAVQIATGMPMWACLTATVLEGFEVPKGVREVVIWGDLDRSGRGEAAARKLQTRLWSEGFKARTYLPSESIPEDAKGVDWLDVWNQKGDRGFPDIHQDDNRNVA